MLPPSLPEPPPPPPPTQPPDEEEREARRHPLIAVTVVVFVLASLGVGAWLVTRPSACSGRAFVSNRFGYCVDPPEGWAGTLGSGSVSAPDSFVARSSPATVEVATVELEEPASLASFVERVEQLDSNSGLLVGERAQVEISGEPAVFFDAKAAGPRGAMEVREVIVVRDNSGWRITFTDTDELFQRDLSSFRSLLDSWRFR